MALAVVADDNSPWVIPVKIQDRQGFAWFEWDSAKDTYHSRAVMIHPEVAITIYDVGRDEYRDIGFYAKARVKMVEDKGDFARYRANVHEAYINDEAYVKRGLNMEQSS